MKPKKSLEEYCIENSLTRLLTEWHSQKNTTTPKNISYNSYQKYWWKCANCSHEWLALLYNRVKKNQDCPKCRKNKIAVTVRKNHPEKYKLLVKERKDIASLWIESKNTVKLEEVEYKRSKEKYWWRCCCGVEWLGTIPKNANCVSCGHKKAGLSNLKKAVKKNGEISKTHPRIASLLNNEKNLEKLSIAPTEIHFSMNKKVFFWNPSCNHESYCTPSRLSEVFCNDEACIRSLIGRKARERALTKYGPIIDSHPQLVREFNIERNAPLKMENLTREAKDSVWWKCSNCGREWKASIRSRAVLKAGCPSCSSSKVEREVRDFLLSKELEIVSQDRSVLEGKEIDLLVPSHSIGVEVNGDYWHSDLVDKWGEGSAREYHEEKFRKALEKNILLVFVWESDWRENQLESINALSVLFDNIIVSTSLLKFESPIISYRKE